MPAAKKPASQSSRSRAAFKEPAALKRLTRSLDTAHEALTELRTHTGPDASRAARDLHKDLRTFVSSARRDTGKLTKALQSHVEQLQKQPPRAKAAGSSRRKASAGRPRKTAASAKRSTGKTP